MNSQMELFFERTKKIYMLLNITLFLLLLIMVVPINLGYGKHLSQIVIIFILSYILYQNFIETRNFALDDDDNEPGSDISIDMRNNMIASYVLCVFILLLVLYVAYSLFF
jgi:hypothetical protein